MEALNNKSELHHFIESASDEILQNFLRSLALRTDENLELREDLNRIVEFDGDIRMKVSELMVDYH